MTEETPEETIDDGAFEADGPLMKIQDDPKRPYKMYAAVLSAFLASFVATSADVLPAWVVGLLTALVAAIAVFLTTNPKQIVNK